MNSKTRPATQPVGGKAGRTTTSRKTPAYVLFRPVRIPLNAHPAVRRLFAEMNAQQCSQTEMARRSGVNRNTLKDWKTRTTPTLDNPEACLNVLDLELVVRERKP